MTNILIVDDDRQVIEYVRTLLDELDYSSKFIVKPDHMFQLLEKETIDLILMDISMPGADGVSQLKKIKAHPAYKNIPVLMLTGESNEQVLANCFEIGASDYITKPISRLILHARLKTALAVSKAKNELEQRVHDRTAQLETSEQLLRQAARMASLGHWCFDEIGQRYLSISEEYARIHGYTVEEYLKYYSSIEESLKLVHPDDRELLSQRYDKHSPLHDYRIICADGRERYVQETIEYIYQDNIEDPVQSVGTIQDITDQKLLELQLRKAKHAAESANWAKSSFLANTSHEIRTPIAHIIGMSDLLKESPLNIDQQSYVESIDNAGDSLLALINNVLDLSKIEAGELKLEHTEFNIKDTLNRIAEEYRPVVVEKNITLHTEIANDVELIQSGDVYRFEQVLKNLMNNAIKFTEQGEITMRADNEANNQVAQSIRFSVSDTGIGIPQEQQGRIFDAFIQQDTSNTRRYGGTGLGLSICRQLVDLMDGRIWIESEPGKGSSFFFTVTFDDRSCLTHVRTPDLTTDTPSKNHRVLVVEDEVIIRALVEEFFKDTPHEIDTVENGEIGVETFKTGNYDMILMDLQMPVMDGYTAAEKIRTWERSQHRKSVPIIAFSASVTTSEIEKCLTAGFTSHLSKPMRKAELLAAISEFG